MERTERQGGRTMNAHTKQHRSQQLVRNLVLFALASVGIAVLSFYGVMAWFTGYFKNLPKWDWGWLSGFTSVLSLSVLAGGLVFGLFEYVSKERTKAREKAKLSYEMYKSIFDKVTDPQQEAARRWILMNIDPVREGEDKATWYKRMDARISSTPPWDGKGLPEGRAAVKLTLNCFDYIGFISDQYWDIEENSLDWISPLVAKVWILLEPYVQEVRRVKQAEDYYVSAERFGNRCIQWRRDKRLPDEVILRDGKQT
jgi:hypothetical protein